MLWRLTIGSTQQRGSFSTPQISSCSLEYSYPLPHGYGCEWCILSVHAKFIAGAGFTNSMLGHMPAITASSVSRYRIASRTRQLSNICLKVFSIFIFV
ncbi:hypothetical protein CEXT_694701 [Caerostris extrusa]|uniref:Uncharacterized protein n=1 Tax=Caerostris extrusa TaxID=172846 RepID=A0AAV4QGC5_CAEEX|nr:hypothetical protein CEXT_694701 [Caerostris extrusa]